MKSATTIKSQVILCACAEEEDDDDNVTLKRNQSETLTESLELDRFSSSSFNPILEGGTVGGKLDNSDVNIVNSNVNIINARRQKGEENEREQELKVDQGLELGQENHIKAVEENSPSASYAAPERNEESTPLDFIGNYFASKIISWVHAYFPMDDKRQRWGEKLIPYMLTVGFVNFNTWGLLSAFIPFAMVL